MFIARFEGQDAQHRFDNYLRPTLKALSAGKYIQLNGDQNSVIITEKDRPQGWRWLVRKLFGPSRNERFDTVSSFVLQLLETNQDLLKGYASDLMQLKGRWNKKDKGIGDRIQSLVDNSHLLEAEIKEIRDAATRDRNAASLELARVGKPVDLTHVLSVIKSMPADCVILCAGGKKVLGHINFLRRFNYFRTLIDGPFKERKEKPELSLQECESKENALSLDICPELYPINLSGDLKANLPGFAEETINAFLYYAYTGFIDSAYSSLAELSSLFVFAEFLSADKFKIDCLEALDTIFTEKPTLDLHINALFNPPVVSETLNDYFAQRCGTYIFWAYDTVKVKLSNTKKKELFDLCQSRYLAACEQETKTEKDILSITVIPYEMRWDQTQDRVAIYMWILSWLYWYGIGVDKDNSKYYEYLKIGIDRNYAPACARSWECLTNASTVDDKAKVKKRMEEAIKAKFYPGLNAMGFAYGKGSFGEKDPVQESHYYHLAASKRIPLAYHNLFADTQDPYYGIEAANLGYAHSIYDLARYYKKNNDLGLARFWADKALDAGFSKAAELIATL